MFKQLVWKKLKRIEGQQTRILLALDEILRTQEKIMSAQEEALAALEKINTATNEQGVSLQKTSDNLDALIAKLGTTVPPDVLAGLQQAADSIAAQAAFSKALASKGAADPVPVPVPVPA